MIAPIARYASLWALPVMVAAGQTHSLQKTNTQYSTLTRMMGSHEIVGEGLLSVVRDFGWNIAALIYHENPPNIGHSTCAFIVNSLRRIVLNNTSTYKGFNERTTTKEDLGKLLGFISKSARSE